VIKNMQICGGQTAVERPQSGALSGRLAQTQDVPAGFAIACAPVVLVAAESTLHRAQYLRHMWYLCNMYDGLLSPGIST
jgi:hypothetical protein